MQPNQISEVLSRPLSQELLAPSAVEELIQQREERERDQGSGS